MNEELLHFIWRKKKFDSKNLTTTDGEAVNIIQLGQHNHLSGPDFFNAQMEIEGQLWAGNLEIHCKASDWYAHGHENDANYDNVVLHVVWEADMPIFRKNGVKIPTLELSNQVEKQFLKEYDRLMRNKSFINCEKDFHVFEDFEKEHWLQRLFVERLEQRSTMIFSLLERSQNDWEKVLFNLLMKNFGLNHNGPIYFEIANRLNFPIVRKLQKEGHHLESVLFGLAGLLEGESADSYFNELKTTFEYLAIKFKLDTKVFEKPNFFGLRPNNFPTLRLSQIANLYSKNHSLFQKLMNTTSLNEVYEIFEVGASEYWDTHYVFGKTSGKRKKKLTKSFIDLLVINTIVPLRFCYLKSKGHNIDDTFFELVYSISPEKNTIIEKFNQIGSKPKNALHTQATLQLYKNYCNKNQCLKCTFGNKLLVRNT